MRTEQFEAIIVSSELKSMQKAAEGRRNPSYLITEHQPPDPHL